MPQLCWELIEATGWTEEYVDGLQASRFWRLAMMMARNPSSPKMARLQMGLGASDHGDTKTTRTEATPELARVAADYLGLG